MKSIKLTLSLAIFLALSSIVFSIIAQSAGKTATPKPQPPKKTTITLLTANVGNATPSLPTQRSQYKLRENNVPILRANIKALNPDIVFLEEIDPSGENQQKRIFDETKYLVTCNLDICIAVRRDKFLFLEDCKSFPGYYVCRSYLKEKYQNLKLFAVHTQSPFDDPQFEKRENQISSILDTIDKENKNSEKIIVGGDFNFDPYNFKSTGYELFNSHNKMYTGLNKWNNLFANQDTSNLKIISSPDPTWFITKFVIQHYRNTLDHVITNFAGNYTAKGCNVLWQDDKRLDTDHSAKRKKFFMDHSALLCTIAVD